ncbi:zinc ribbon domain-containing protein [Levilactobacillus tangyuanensis]|uniref:Zinc ribbon domain-containing protein n=1 Tax=Levilactobacillus tangyuanensis TaxID=2486021 RepID=A0ABW1TLY8_9LACO|nr:zinc ribbon domain-containing protein [Levilactobacillus tangyuanensis]
MKQNIYRICSKCGHQNTADANFCLQCGTTLTTDDDYIFTPYAADKSFPLFDLELTPEELAETKNFMITKSDIIPTGYRSAGLVFAESSVSAQSGMKPVWEDLMKRLYGLMLAKHYAGVARVSIESQSAKPGQLFLTGEAFVPNNQL